MSGDAGPAAALAPDDLVVRLAEIELFAGLSSEQLGWIASVSQVEELVDGDVLFTEDGEATHFYVLLDGELVISKLIDGHEEVLTRHQVPAPPSGQNGKPAAAHRFTGEMPLLTDGVNVATASVHRQATVLSYPRDVFLELIGRCPSIARVMLPVLAWRIRSSELQARSQATIAALATLAAGLAHELNNPTAAVTRTANELAPAVTRLEDTARAWGGQASPADQDILAAVIADARRLAEDPQSRPSDPLAAADAEDALLDWAEEQGVSDPGQLAAALANIGGSVEWLQDGLSGLPEPVLTAALDHLSATLDVSDLIAELRAAGPRISALVSATRDYANLDRAPEQELAVTDGLEATLTMLRGRLGGVRLVRDYQPGLPRIHGYPSELNQVWTNLIDNAVDAMSGAGLLTVRVEHDTGCVTVSISDTGSGIPPDVLCRIFEPFYTTKDVGKGTGLGLNLSHRIVTQRHGGSISARSVPGDTTITVRLPVGGRASRTACVVPRPAPEPVR